MADAKDKTHPAPAAGAAPAAAAGVAPKGKSPIKIIAIVGAMMLAEAGGVYVLVGMSGACAQTANAEIKGEAQAELAQPVEIELVDEKFQNMQTGRVWIWDTQIVLKVKKKNEPFIEEALAS